MNKKHLNIIMLTIFLAMHSSYALARTWIITPDSFGDAPTISAGVDSATAGDTVLVMSGTYVTWTIEMKDGVRLLSQEGPLHTKLIPLLLPENNFPLCAIAANSIMGFEYTEISGFWIEGFIYSTLGAIDLFQCHSIYVKNNILTGNEIGIRLSSCDIPNVENNLFFDNYTDLDAFTSSGFVRWNIFWGPRVLDVSHTICYCNDFKNISDCAFPTQNFSEDPQFCGIPGSNNLYLQSDSPCAPGNAPLELACGLIGPLPVNCGSVDIKKKTWGEIKTLYE